MVLFRLYPFILRCVSILWSVPIQKTNSQLFSSSHCYRHVLQKAHYNFKIMQYGRCVRIVAPTPMQVPSGLVMRLRVAWWLKEWFFIESAPLSWVVAWLFCDFFFVIYLRLSVFSKNKKKTKKLLEKTDANSQIYIFFSYYPHRSRDSLYPLFGIFLYQNE